MCLFENSKILETGIKMMQPDMIRTINGYKAYYAIDYMISQIYTFEVNKEKLILDTTVPDAGVDLLFFEKISGEFGARIIGSTKSRLSSYVVFEENTSFLRPISSESRIASSLNALLYCMILTSAT